MALLDAFREDWHTVRYGLRPSAADVPRFSEYQDLLQLTLPGDGSYYVAMFPRKPDEKVPTFATSVDGRGATLTKEPAGIHRLGIPAGKATVELVKAN